MKNVVLGKHILKEYRMNKYIKNGKYIDKPQFEVDNEYTEWEEICSFDGDFTYNNGKSDQLYFFFSNRKINISENEEVSVVSTTMRADLGEVHMKTDKVLNEENVYLEYTNEERANDDLHQFIQNFNQHMISQDDKLSSYCKLHSLVPADTDCMELYKQVYGKECIVEDDRLVPCNSIWTSTLTYPKDLCCCLATN